MKTKKEFYHSILKQNKNESLLTNQKKFNATLKIQKDIEEQYPIQKNKLQIFKKRINDIIKEYHNELL